MSSLADFVALSLLPLHWHADIAAHLRAGAGPRETFACLAARRSADLREAPASFQSRASVALARAAAAEVHAIAFDDPAYPAALAAIVDPPPILWMRGAAAALDRIAVAIVGSRAGSAYALAVGERLAADLARAGVAVVSGLARGVDAAAHRGALASGGTTIGVLGSGADVLYPREHRPLAAALVSDGALVSELPPGTRPRPHFFPRRNRIISGLARAVIVIEAGEKSGSLITARCALEQGRDVMAVPGSILNGRNRGGHALLRDGAKIVESADDILEELGLSPCAPLSSGPAGRAPFDPILACLSPGEPSDVDCIAGATGLVAAKVLARLLELELSGAVRRVGGGRFVRVDRTC